MPKFLSDVSVYAPQLHLSSGATSRPTLVLESTEDTAGNQGSLVFQKDSSTEDGEKLGVIQWRGQDSTGIMDIFTYIESEIVDNTNTTELGKLTIGIRHTNTLANGFAATAVTGTVGRVDTAIGSTTSSVTTIAGNLTLSGDTITSADDLNIVATGNDITVDTDNFTITSSASNKPLLTLEGTVDTQESQPEIVFKKNSAATDNEDLGVIRFKGLDDESSLIQYGYILGEAVDVSSATPTGKISIFAVTTRITNDLEVGDKITECKRKFSPTGSSAAGTNSGGDIVYIGTGSTVLGEIVHYKSDGTWEAADATDVTKCDGLLGVALGTDPDVNGVLLRGMVTIADIHGTEDVGMPLFLSEDAAGHANMDAPAGDNQIVRIIGYCLHATNGEIWFNPDNTFVEVTA